MLCVWVVVADSYAIVTTWNRYTNSPVLDLTFAALHHLLLTEWQLFRSNFAFLFSLKKKLSEEPPVQLFTCTHWGKTTQKQILGKFRVFWLNSCQRWIVSKCKRIKNFSEPPSIYLHTLEHQPGGRKGHLHTLQWMSYQEVAYYSTTLWVEACPNTLGLCFYLKEGIKLHPPLHAAWLQF